MIGKADSETLPLSSRRHYTGGEEGEEPGHRRSLIATATVLPGDLTATSQRCILHCRNSVACACERVRKELLGRGERGWHQESTAVWMLPTIMLDRNIMSEMRRI